MSNNKNNNNGTTGRLDPSKAVVFVCDVQERFRSVIDGFPHCVYVSSTMMRAAGILDIPIVVTEQYPERHGSHAQKKTPPPTVDAQKPTHTYNKRKKTHAMSVRRLAKNVNLYS